MNRRTFLSAVTGNLLAAPLAAGAQSTARLPRIGILTPGTAATTQDLFEAFRRGMRERGYIEGQHVIFERHFGAGKPDRLSDAAAELARRKVDVIVASTDPAIAAIKQQTRTIPIVMANSTDPVTTGFVVSLARPGGNITGNSGMSPELSGKRLELLREVVPRLSRVAFLWNPDIRGAVLDYKETQDAARSLQLQLQSVEVSRADDLDRALSELTTGQVNALIVPAPNPVAYANRAQIARFAQQHRLPSMYGTRAFAEVGGLMAFGPSAADQWRRAATYVDKILRGAKPADLPVEQPEKFELVINLKTAKALGLTIPPSLLQQADQVIE